MVLTDDNFATIVAAVEEGRPRLRQHPQVHPLHLRPRHARGGPVPRLRAVRRRDPAAADGAADPRDRPRHRDAAGARARPRAGRARASWTGRRARAESGIIDPRDARRAPGCGWACSRPLLVWAASSACCSRAGWRPGDADRRRAPAAPRLPAGHDDDVRRHRRLPGRHRVRRAHRARLAARGRRVLQPAAALGHRLRARLRRRR